ncbi:MAG: hypothetical protein K2R98_14750 [Gemmataceae bacterium]|nr:hypothetical protein [Gemmataceae bacterium]
MQLYMRIVFGLNALYQTVVGLICLLGPTVAISLHGGSAADQSSTLLMVAFRVIGVNLVPVGVMSALVAGNPDSYPVLRALMGLVAVLSLVCWGIVIGRHDLNASQISLVVLDIVVQSMVIVTAVFYHPKSKGIQVTTSKRRAVAA